MSNIITLSAKTRFNIKSAACAITFCISSQSVLANDFPQRPIKMIVPFGAGTTTDIVARTVADAMGKQLNQALIVENRAGAGGAIGSSAVAKSTPDGYTLLMGTSSTHGSNPTLYKNLPYDVMKDFVPVLFVGSTPNLLVVATSSPLKSLGDLKAAAAKSPGLTFASAGTGTTGHLAGELLKTKISGSITHVPYKEGAQAVTDVISGQTNFMFYHPAAVMPHIKAGRLRALGSSGAETNVAAPDVTPIAQQGYPDFDLVSWFMVYAPSATPSSVLAKLRSAATASLRAPDVIERFSVQGIGVGSMSGEEMVNFNRAELAKWGSLVQKSGATVD
jgi:tripartite-type tricarboxylate transporter receptor subunit TctC